MDELEAIRRQKMAKFQAMQQKQFDDETQFAQQVDALEQFVRPKLDKDALARYGNIKAANPERAVNLLAVLAKLIQQNEGKLIEDKILKLVLLQMQPKREIKITRK